MSIRKLVVVVAGYGTRFLPFTKSIPKEMLPIVDRPVIQYIVEEAVQAGIEEVILITGYSKRAIEDYFDYNLELEYLLEKSGKLEQKKMIRDISDVAKFVYVRQKEQLGTGHAALQAKEVVGNEPFIFMSGDDVYRGRPTKIERMIAAYNQHHAPVLFAMKKDKPGDGDKNGFVKLGKDLGNGVFETLDFIEKPGDANKPSDWASLLCHILTPDIFPILEQQEPGKGGEIWMTDAVRTLMQKRMVVTQTCEDLKYYDCGNKLEYLKAVVEFAMDRPDINGDFKAYLRGLDLQ
jgi:UTP--glucose-1-phosphate uridylyltransferase